MSNLAGGEGRGVISIRWKLLAATAVVGAIAAVIAVVGLVKIYELHRQLNALLDESTHRMKIAEVLEKEEVAIPILRESLSNYADDVDRKLNHLREQNGNTYVASRNLMLVFGTLGILASVTVTFFMGQRIVNRLTRLSEYASRVQSTGDLSQPVPQAGRDEVGKLAQSFDHMRLSLYTQARELATVNRAMASQSDEMEQFFYTVSHDLRSPLVSCKGLVGLIREDLEDKRYDEMLLSAQQLESCVERMGRILDELLTFSRIGRKPMNLSVVNTHSLVELMKSDFAGELQKSNAVLNIEGRLPATVSDPSDLRRIFENLLTNALKYACNTPAPVLTLGGSETGDEVRYYFRDNGPGIEPANQETIFNLFQRLDTDKQGTGIGLASVAKVMRMHGGKVWVESELGKGATFWLSFPKRTVSTAVSPILANAAIPQPTPA